MFKRLVLGMSRESVRSKVFQSGNSQAIRIPSKFRFPEGATVLISKDGSKLVISLPRPWDLLESPLSQLTDDFSVKRDS